MENVKEMVNNTVEATTNTFNKVTKESWVKNAGIIGGIAIGAYVGFEYALKPLSKKAKHAIENLKAKKKPNKVEEVVEKAEEIVEEVVEEIEETLE